MFKIIAVAVALFSAVNGYSSPIMPHGARHARSPQLGGLFGGCRGKCNQQGYRLV